MPLRLSRQKPLLTIYVILGAEPSTLHAQHTLTVASGAGTFRCPRALMRKPEVYRASHVTQLVNDRPDLKLVSITHMGDIQRVLTT